MSPPQVNLGVKPSPLVSEEEMLMEKKDKTDADSIVTVEVETKGKGNYCCKNLSRRCRIICYVAVIAMIAATVAVVLGLKFGLRHHHEVGAGITLQVGKIPETTKTPNKQTNQEEDYFDYDGNGPPRDLNWNWCGVQYPDEDDYNHYQEHRDDYQSQYEENNCTGWTCLYGKSQIAEMVWIDEDLQLIHAVHGHGSDDEPSMHIIQDYINHMVAYKDTDRDVCYIATWEVSFTGGFNIWLFIDNGGKDPRTLRLLSNNRTEPEEVRRIAGESIYKLCENSQSFLAEEINEKDVTSSMTIVKV